MKKKYQNCKNWGSKLCDLTAEIKRDRWSAYPRAEGDMKNFLSICEKCLNYEKEVDEL
jgi:hypothetical protein